MTDFSSLSYTSTSKIPTLSYTQSWEKYAFRMEPPHIGRYREYPLPPAHLFSPTLTSIEHSPQPITEQNEENEGIFSVRWVKTGTKILTLTSSWYLEEDPALSESCCKIFWRSCNNTIHIVKSNCIFTFILLHEKFLQFDWLRAVVFQLNLKYLHVKITNLLRVVV